MNDFITNFLLFALLCSPTFYCIILLAELKDLKRTMLDNFNDQNRALSTIMEALIRILQDTTNTNTIVMEDRK